MDHCEDKPLSSFGFNFFGLPEHIQEKIIQLPEPGGVARNIRAAHPVFNKFLNQDLGAVIRQSRVNERQTWQFNLERDSIVVNDMKIPRLVHSRVSVQMFRPKCAKSVFRRIISVNSGFREDRSNRIPGWHGHYYPQTRPAILFGVGDTLQDFPHLGEFTVFIANKKALRVPGSASEILRLEVKRPQEILDQIYPLTLEHAHHSIRPTYPGGIEAESADGHSEIMLYQTLDQWFWAVPMDTIGSEKSSLWLCFRYFTTTGRVQFCPLHWSDIREAFELPKQREKQRLGLEKKSSRMPTKICKLWVVRPGGAPKGLPGHAWVEVNLSQPRGYSP